MNLFILILSLLFITPSFAGDIEVYWNKNPSHENVKYYLIFMAKNTSSCFTLNQSVSGIDNKSIIRNLPVGKYRFYVVAINDFGMSPKSDTTRSTTLTKSVVSEFTIQPK